MLMHVVTCMCVYIYIYIYIYIHDLKTELTECQSIKQNIDYVAGFHLLKLLSSTENFLSFNYNDQHHI